MLVKCPECELQVSDKAVTCPHCGYPLKSNARQRISTKRKKLPNGFGQISFIKGNLRKPYRAMISVAKTPLGRPVCKVLSYHATYNEAYEALLEYHKDPNKAESNISMEELYERWLRDFKGAPNYLTSLKSAWPYCSVIHKVEVRNIRVRHIKSCIENGSVMRNEEVHLATDNTRRTIKSLLSSLLDYAIEYDLINHNYASDVDLGKIAESSTPARKNEHLAFNDSELKYLHDNLDMAIVKMIWVQSYTGMRPNEMLDIRKDTVNFDKWYFVGGLKTKAGKERIIPIHEEIRDLIREFYDNSENGYLFPIQSYKVYNKRFTQVMPGHLPHDPRKTFVTYAKKYKMDEYAIKRIIGHKIKDITEEVYTERSIDWLHEELKKIILYV